MALGVEIAAVCSGTEATVAATDESTTADGSVFLIAAAVDGDPTDGPPTGMEAVCEELLDEIVEVSVCIAEATGVVFRGVGNRIGVTATTRAVSNSAIESLLSIYGTGSKPPGRKG